MNNGFAIELIKIKKAYSENKVLIDLNLQVKKGCVTSIIGPNGSGKTTLFKILLGISDADEGKIVKPDCKSIGFLIEDFMPYDRLNLIQNLKAFSLLTDKSISRSEIKDIVSISFCDKIKYKTIKKLSGGQKRKIFFALSLLNDPEIMVLDEPLNSLDLKERIDIISSIRYLKENRGKTIIISSHDLNSLYELSDVFCFLKEGRIFQTLNKADIEQENLNELYLKLY